MGRREDFMAGLAPLQDDAVPPLHRDLKQLFPTDEAFRKWEDSLWLGLFFARRLTGVLAERPRVDSKSPAGRIQSFLEVAQGEGAFFGPQSLLRDLPLAIRRTCCVRIDGNAYGTGFLVGADLVLTNWHVVRSILKPEEHAERVSVAFDYLHEAGVGEPPLTVPASKITRWRPARPEFLPDAEPSPRPLDYAVVRLAAALPAERGFFDLGATPDLATGSRVVIVGHPRGQPLAVSFSRSVGLHGLDDALAYYDADTLHGSSGSLVLLESQNQLKAALLHAGGKTADENFGIHLKAIHSDLEGLVVEAPVAVAKPPAKLEGFFGSDSNERAGQLATLLSVLPSEVKIDTDASISQQIQSLEGQWDERFSEALQIARAVAVPASDEHVAEVSREHRDSVATHAEMTPQPGSRKIIAYIFLAVALAATAVIFIPRLFDKKQAAPPPPPSTETCGITQSSYLEPQRRELECSGVPTPARTQCSVVIPQGGTIHGECYHGGPSGAWAAMNPMGQKIWSINFETGDWDVPYTYDHRIQVQALERRTGADWELESRSYRLPMGAEVTELPKQHVVRMRCAKTGATAELRDGGDRAGFTITSGNTTLDAQVQRVSFRGKQFATTLINSDELTAQFRNLWSEIEECHPIAIEAPACKLSTWDKGCGTSHGPVLKNCFQHLDAAKSIDEKSCGTIGVLERSPGSPQFSGAEATAMKAGCGTVTRCLAKLLSPTELGFTPRLEHPYVVTLRSRVTFPVAKCKSAVWQAPVKLADKWVVSAKCVCSDNKQTPTASVATFVTEADMPDSVALTSRFKALGNACGL